MGMLNEQAYQTARRLIIEGRLEPGMRISEPELSAQLALGTAAVRTALTRLAQEGLVNAIPRKGYVISPLTMTGAQEMMDVRIALESRAAFLAAGRLPAAEVHDLRRHFAAGYRIDDRPGLDLLLQKNSEFRKMVARASGNARLATLVASLVDEMERYLRLSWETENRSERLLSGFEELVAALESGRAQAAQKIVVDQMTLTTKHILAALATRQQKLAGFSPAC